MVFGIFRLFMPAAAVFKQLGQVPGRQYPSARLKARAERRLSLGFGKRGELRLLQPAAKKAA